MPNSSKLLLSFINILLFGNIYIALGSVCLIQSTIIQLQFAGHLFAYSLLVFFATLFVYNFQRLFYKPAQDDINNSIRRKWIFENQALIKLLTFVGAIGVCVSFFFNNYTVAFYLSPLLILSLAYFSPFIKLRKSPWFKLFTLVIVWTMVTAVVPVLLNNPQPFTKSNLLHIFLRFCFMMAICIPFDIRDLNIDAAENVATLPHTMGERKTIWLAFGFVVLYVILIVIEFTLGTINIKTGIVLLLSAMINAVLVLMSSSKRSEYFYVAAMDGTMILQGMLLIFLNLC